MIKFTSGAKMKNKLKILITIFLIQLILLCLTGCVKKETEMLPLDNSEPMSLAPDVEWAVVTSPYAAFRQEHDWDAKVLSHARKGDIIQITGKTSNPNNNQWYNTKSGWLPKSSISVYSNRLKAEAIAKKIIEGEND